MPHVLCLRPIHPDAIARMRDTAGVTVDVLEEVTPATLARALPGAHAVTVRATPIDRALLDQAPALRIVARHGVGYDAVDVAALTARGIPLTVTPDANAVSVAEHAMMLLLACARRARDYDLRLRDGRWGAAPDLPTFDLCGRTLLVMGFGRIGGRVARLAHAFGMRVLVRDPFVARNTIKGAGFAPADDLAAALAEADAVTLHLPSSETTRGIVDAGFLATMRPGAVLVNTARGTLVDQDALATALRDGRLGAAGLDVFETEPPTTRPALFDLPNVVLTPHTAAATAESMRGMALSCADSILACFAGQLDPEVVVNVEVLRGNA